MLNFRKNNLADRRKVSTTGYTNYSGFTYNLTLLVAAPLSECIRDNIVDDIAMMTEQKRTPCTKLSLNAAKFSGPFFTSKILKTQKSLWNKCSNLSPQWILTSLLLTSQQLVWEGSVGVKRSRKALCVLWGTLPETMEKFLNIGKCFLEIKRCTGMWEGFQSTSLAQNISNLTAGCQYQFCGRAISAQWHTGS